MDIRYILALSSGSIASLSQTRDYSTLDRIVDAWISFELSDPTQTDAKWQQSWERFTQSPTYTQLVQKES